MVPVRPAMNLGILTYCLFGLLLCHVLVMSERETFAAAYAGNRRKYGRILTDAGLILLIACMAVGWPIFVIIQWAR